MKDWKNILYNIYSPEIGSIWAAPNGIWDNGFAANKSEKDYHPSLVENYHPSDSFCKLIPGTSKDYTKGSCVYKVNLNHNNSSSRISHFLIKFSMTITIEDLLKLKKSWNGIEKLNDDNLINFKRQIKFCKGIDV
jgi:hypothetical protein